MNKRKLNLKMSTRISEDKEKSAYKAKLDIDEDTSFDISYDTFIYEENKKYIYIKLEENTAMAPFYYNRSYEINELHEIHNIFRAVDIEETKEFLKGLFDNNRVKLRYEGDMVIMELCAGFFHKQIQIKFELYKEMVPEREKDEKLLELYHIEKRNLKIAKELKNYLKQNQNEMNQKILNYLYEHFELNDEPSSSSITGGESKGESKEEGESNYDEE